MSSLKIVYETRDYSDQLIEIYLIKSKSVKCVQNPTQASRTFFIELKDIKLCFHLKNS